ncbi:MAG TPA: bacillithiol transferase BstA [Pyrinomonadaceae bacterium]
MKTSDDLRYPVGQFAEDAGASRQDLIEEIAAAPRRLREAVAGLSAEQLDTPYRPGGWTVRQVVHHVPDSHLNSYVRFKLALTEDEPAIRTYHEELWAELPDSRATPVEVSLALLDSLHERWVILLRSLEEAGFHRTFSHPEWGVVTLDKAVGLYAWHGRHHVAHVTSLRERMGW